MSKSKTLLGIALIGVIIFSLYASVRVAYSADTVLSEVNSIIEQVQEIRGLTFKEMPQIEVITKAQALAMWHPSPVDMERMRIAEMTYKMTFLLPPDYQYIKDQQERSAGWIAATVGNKIYIIQENFMSNPAVAKRSIAHELTHVLQKQWFNAKYGAGTFDGTLAVRALVEGDADLVADLYCERNGIPIEKIRSLTGDPMTDINIFSYVFGDPFVRYLYEKGGWKLVNEAYSHYPVSTAQIMDPELYLENVTPVNVSLEVPKNWSIMRDDRMGEFYVYVILRDVAKKDNETAWNVSSAWVGDRLILASNGTNYILLWKVEFSNESAAKAFGETLEELARGNTYAKYTIRIDGKTVLLKAVRGARIEA